MAAARASEALIRRTLKAWTEATGLPAGGVEVRPDGTVRVLAPAGETPITSAGTDDEEARCAAAFGVGR